MKNKIIAILLVFALTIGQVAGANAMGVLEGTEQNEISIEEISESVEDFSAMTGEDIGMKDEEISINEGRSEMEIKKEPVKIQTIEEDGITYYIETYYEGDKKYVKTYSDKMDDVSIVSIDEDNVYVDVYQLNDKETKYEKLSMEISNDTCSNDDNSVVAQAIKYNSKVKCSIGSYYYQNGNNKKTYGKKVKK